MMDEVRLRPVQADEFDAFIQGVLAQYVRDMVANANMTRDEAEDKAGKDHATILPDGFATPGHNFYVIEDALRGARLGRLWLAVTGSGVFLYEIFLEPEARGHGLGRRTMLLLEEEMRQRGLHRIDLNVFAGNHVARSLYESLGYAEVAVRMRKQL